MRPFAAALLGWVACCGLLAGCTSSTSARHAKQPAISSTVVVPDSSTVHRNPSSSSGGGKVAVGPWGALPVGGPAAHGRPLAGDRSSLYVSDGAELFRVDPITGLVLARRSDLGAAARQAVLSGGALWTISATGGASRGAAELRALNLATLAPIATVTITIPDVASVQDAVLDSDRHGNRLFVAIATTISVIDTTTHKLIGQYPVSGGQIAGIAINPDDTRLYVTVNRPNSGASAIVLLDPDTGRSIRAAVLLDGGTGWDGIHASSGGIWLLTGSGTTYYLIFHAATDLNGHGIGAATAGGGWPVTSTVTDSVVWIGGTSNIACADPVTGASRASANVPSPSGDAANISSLIPAGDDVFAYYTADAPTPAEPTDTLIRLTPPVTCAA